MIEELPTSKPGNDTDGTINEESEVTAVVQCGLLGGSATEDMFIVVRGRYAVTAMPPRLALLLVLLAALPFTAFRQDSLLYMARSSSNSYLYHLYLAHVSVFSQNPVRHGRGRKRRAVLEEPYFQE